MLSKRKLDYKTYFILNCSTGADVKIGKSSNPKKRLSVIQPGNHSKLVILAILEEDIEKELHIKFKEYHSFGEWYRFEGELKNYISSLVQDD